MAFGKQISDLENRAGEIPVAIVRATDFPKGGKVITQIARMLKRHGEKVVVADAEWRRMLAFEAFRTQNVARPDFIAWQKNARPLGELASLQKILKLTSIVSLPRPPVAATPAPEPPPSTPDPTPPAPHRQTSETEIVLGRTLSIAPSPVTFEPNEFAQHAAFLGGTGSGKTTAALNLIEQLLARDVPAVLVDRKGDLCRYADPAAWGRPLGDPRTGPRGRRCGQRST